MSIKNKGELLGLFPDGYEFLVFRHDASDRQSGLYVLEPMGDLVDFDLVEQHDIVAYPVEKKSSIPLKGSGT